KPCVLVIAGPTGVGKTRVAVALARRTSIEVISADSRQVYRGMDAATGKPTREERLAVVHHLIDAVDPDDRYQAARFRSDAAGLVEAIRARGRLPVVVGGTGLYIRALVRGLDPAPAADPAFRRELSSVAQREGRVALHRRLAVAAPEVARRLHPNDEVRVVRALEIVRAGGGVAQGALAPAEALRLMQRDTVRYAKRQWTWFQREPDVEWIDVGGEGAIEGAARRIEARLREEGVIA